MTLTKPATVGQLTRLIRDLSRWADLRKERGLNTDTLTESVQRLEEYRSIVVVQRNQQQQVRKVG